MKNDDSRFDDFPLKNADLVSSRPLASKSGLSSAENGYAILFLNNHNKSMPMSCDKACMAKLMAPAATMRPDASFSVVSLMHSTRHKPPAPLPPLAH